MRPCPPPTPLWIDAATIAQLMSPAPMIAALRLGFQRGAEMIPRQQFSVDAQTGASLLCMFAWSAGVGRVAKIMSAVPANAALGLPTNSEVLSLFAPDTGALLASIEAAPLTRLRTAAASALAAQHLARHDARVLAVFATGPLALPLAQAHASLRDYQRILVWGRDLARAQATAAQMRVALPALEIIASDDAAFCAAQADVISCATRASTPVLRGDWLKPGTHVDLVGGYTPQMREADNAVVKGAEIWLDLRENGLKSPGDITQPLADGVISEADIKGDLRDLSAAQGMMRGSDHATTVFKSVGCSLEDLYAARALYDLYRARF